MAESALEVIDRLTAQLKTLRDECLRKQGVVPEKQAVEPVEAVKPVRETLKLAVIQCHNSRSRGAYSPQMKSSEWIWAGQNNQHFKTAAADTRVEVRLFERNWNPLGYRAELNETYRRADDWGADLCIEPHFNAAGDSSVTGTEILHCEGCKFSERLARTTQELMLKHSRLRDRGVKSRTSAERGGYSLVAGKAPTVLTEFSFAGSNSSDAAVLMAKWQPFVRDFVALLDENTLDSIIGRRPT